MNPEILPENLEQISELPHNTPDQDARDYVRYIEQSGETEYVLNFINEKMNTAPDNYESMDDFLAANPGYEEKLSSILSPEEKQSLINYSGSGFVWINSVARGFWDYDKMGKKTPELEESIKNDTRNIISAIDKAPAPEKDFMTYRGTNLDEFRNFGIENLSDLNKMKGQFMLEQGFTSSAIVRERGFADREESSLWVGSSNIEIRFHIPAGAKDVITLSSKETSYAPAQTEVLMAPDSLLYISDVNFDSENHAIINALFVPENVWDKNKR